MRVRMFPHVSELRGESGINRVVEAYHKYLPDFGIEMAEPDATSYDLTAAHAGITGGEATVCHAHGLYWSNDFNSAEWEYRVNARVIEAIRHAKEITVPSQWVNETFLRDIRKPAHVIPHGIDWQEWQHKEECQGFVLWNKNRNIDACDNSILNVLVGRFPDVPFVSTLPTQEMVRVINSPMWPKNFKILPHGVKTPHKDMKGIVQTSGVYLSTTKETFGIGVLEAMASGVPVLGYAWGGNLDLVQTGINGYLARPNDIGDLCEGLNYCIKHRRTLGRNGIELAKSWTWAHSCELVAGVYRLAMEEKPATVSVVIPVYNKSNEQLGRAIKSCLDQTYQPEQITVVNDGSSNDEEIRQCVAGFSNTKILYISQSNQGVANARNNGISATNSKYIACLDSDDFLEPNFLSVCVSELEKDRSLGICYTGLKWHKSDGSFGISDWPTTFNPDKQLSYPKQNQVPTCCVYRKDAWARVGGYKSRYCPNGAGSEDAALWSAICSIGYNARLVTIDRSDDINRLVGEIAEFKAKMITPVSDIESLSPELKQRVYDQTDKLYALMNELEVKRDLHGQPQVLFNYSAEGGTVHGNKEYIEMDWLSLQPWAKDHLHPFASVATPKRHSHPVRQYDQPTISIIIPVGPGHEREVINALDSLEMQHFRKWEAIIVSDIFDKASPHGWLDRLKVAYPYIRDRFTGGSKGAGFARNWGVSMARAPLLLFLDADDVLVDAHALDKMIQAWNKEEAVIYSDYLGKAVWDYEEAVKAMGDDLLGYNEKTQTAVFKKQSADFDCAKAQRQPEFERASPNMPYYHWCLVSVLIPKLWHDEIGGFDEGMETWEDVDYMWRLARGGKCFYRVPDPLVMYSYHKGYRREKSAVVDESTLQKHKNLVQYIKRKYEGTKPVGCNCGGKRQTVQVNGSEAVEMAADTQFVMIELTFPETMTQDHWGQPLKSITGQRGPDNKVLDYKGYSRRRGERFLVHVNDQRARPDMFRLVSDVKLPEAPKVELAEPTLLVKARGKRAKVAA